MDSTLGVLKIEKKNNEKNVIFFIYSYGTKRCMIEYNIIK